MIRNRLKKGQGVIREVVDSGNGLRKEDWGGVSTERTDPGFTVIHLTAKGIVDRLQLIPEHAHRLGEEYDRHQYEDDGIAESCTDQRR